MRARSPASGVGLDIGASGVRAAHVAFKSGRWTVLRWAAVDLPPGSVDAGAIVDERSVVRAIKQVWRAGGFRSRQVVVGIPDRALVTRQVDLPWMPHADFRSALRYLVADYLPVDLASVELDYHVLEEFVDADARGTATDMNRALVVAAESELVAGLAGAVRKAGLAPAAADSDAFALVRAALGGRLTSTGQARLVVDVGADQVTMVVHVDGQPRLLRTVANLGGATATAAVAEALDVTLPDAEQIKQATGLLGPSPVVAPVPESSVFRTLAVTPDATAHKRSGEVIAILNPWAASVVAEIRNSIDYYRTSHPTSPVVDVTVTGRSIGLSGFVARVATQVTLPILPMDPLAGLAASPRVAKAPPPDTRCVVAIGLALRGAR